MIRGALLECGVDANDLSQIEFQDADTFFYFRGVLGTDCDKFLEATVRLACAADKLAELSEATGPVVWPKAGPASGSGPVPFIFPPQSAEARHIIRDAALHTLAHIAWLDMLPKTGAETGNTCTDLYAHALEHPNQVNTEDLFGIVVGKEPNEALPGLPGNNGLLMNIDQDVPYLASSRLKLKAHLLRAGARLIPNLVEDSVYGDLAGAARKRSAQGDFRRGLAALWGNSSDGYYNSNAHVARVLGLRWQLPLSALAPGQDLPDAICGTFHMHQTALAQVYGDDYEARVGSLPAITNSQAEAIKRFEGTGVVFDDDALKNVTVTELRSAVIEQLLFAEAQRRGDSVDSFRVTPPAQVFISTFDGVSDEDFLFAAKTTQDRYRVITNAGSTQWDASLTATENLPANMVLSTNPAGMHVFRGPLPKQDLTMDTRAKLGGLQVVAQCTEAVPGGLATGTDYGVNFAMQDSFTMAHTLYNRLVVLREVTAPLNDSDPRSEANKIAEAATAEVRAWSGEGRLYAAARNGPTGQIRTIEVAAVGFEPEELGVEHAHEISDRLVLVWGTPHIAECAAGQAIACPEDIESYIANPVNHDFRSLWPGYGDDTTTVPVPNGTGQLVEQPVEIARRFYGADGTVGHLRFNIASAGPMFRPTNAGTGAPRQRLYVVLRTDPTAGTGAGRVLGALALRSHGQVSGVLVSKRQAELYQGAFGIGSSGLFDMNVTGSRSLAEPDRYCLPGVSYRTFVPLESELTSDGDTYESRWRSLISEARASAERADALADKMLDFGLQKELRREGANEKLADICGSYGLVDDTTFATGKVSAGESDGPLADCMNTESKDIVFLGGLPEAFTNMDEPARQTYLRENVLNCNGVETANKSGLCADAELRDLSYGALELENIPDFEAPTYDCASTDSIASNLPTGLDYNTIDGISQAPWLGADRLSYLLSALAYVEEIPTGSTRKNWYLVWNHTTTIMSSTGLPMDGGSAVPDIWPGCQVKGTCPADDDDVGLARAFARIFGTEVAGTTITTDDIGWRLQGALWTLAAFSTKGVVPPGLFRLQVPVANYHGDPSDRRFVPAIYGNGEMFLDAVSGKYKLRDGYYVPGEVASLLGESSPLADGYMYPVSLASGLYPEWLSHLWSRVWLTAGSNPPDYLTSPAESTEHIIGGRSKPGQDWRTLAAGFNNMRCAGTMFRGTGEGAADAAASLALLREIKVGKSVADRRRWSNVCSRPLAVKRGSLQLLLDGDGEAAVRFSDVLLAGKCDQDDYEYGYDHELMSRGSRRPPFSPWWYVWLEGNSCAVSASRPQSGELFSSSRESI